MEQSIYIKRPGLNQETLQCLLNIACFLKLFLFFFNGALLGIFMPTVAERLKAHREAEFAKLRGGPVGQKDLICIGTYISGDTFPQHIKRTNGQLFIPASLYYRQSIVIGRNGTGKSVFLKSGVYQFLKYTDYDVVVVDGRGDRELAESLAVMADEEGFGPTPIVRQGYPEGYKTAVLNGWIGSNVAIYNQLVTMLNLEKVDDAGVEHYLIAKRGILALVCGINLHVNHPEVKPFEPPRSFQELKARVSISWLTKAYENSPYAKSRIEIYSKGQISPINQFSSDLSSITDSISHMIDPRGFQLGQHRLTIFSLNALVAKNDAPYTFGYLIGVFKNHMQSGKPTIYFFDEPNPLGPENLLNLINMGRGLNAGTISYTQSLSTLGKVKNVLDQIIEGVNIRFIFKSQPTEDVLELFGTEMVSNISHSIKDGEIDRTTVAKKEVGKVSAEELESLPVGTGFVVYDGKRAKFQVPMWKPSKPFNENMEVLNVREDQIFKSEPKESEKGVNTVTAPMPTETDDS